MANCIITYLNVEALLQIVAIIVNDHYLNMLLIGSLNVQFSLICSRFGWFWFLKGKVCQHGGTLPHQLPLDEYCWSLHDKFIFLHLIHFIMKKNFNDWVDFHRIYSLFQFDHMQLFGDHNALTFY